MADQGAQVRSEAIDAYRVRVLSRLLRRGIPRDDADSATQEVLRRALHRSEACTSDAEFRALLLRIAERVCLDYYRQRRQESQLAHTPGAGVRTGTISCLDFQVSAFIARNSPETRAR